MDETDEAIVELLQVDGRLAHREIARLLGISRSTAAARVQRLVDSGQVVVRGVAHPAVLGRGELAHVSVTVRGSARAVAEAIAARDDTAFVSLTSGPRAVVTELRAASRYDVDSAVAQLRALPGVEGIDTVSYVEVVRDVVGPVGEVDHGGIDATDRALLRALQADGRASYVDLARLSGLSPAGARRRVVRLLDEQVLRVGALVRQSGQDRQGAMGLGLRLAGDHAGVIDALGALAPVTFVARTLGHFDVIVTMRALTTGPLVDTLDRIRGLEGVAAVETWVHLDVVKESYAVGLAD